VGKANVWRGFDRYNLRISVLDMLTYRSWFCRRFAALAAIASLAACSLVLTGPWPFVASVDAQAPRLMSLVDLAGVPRISDTQLSPDGRSVTYNLANNDLATNRQLVHVWKQTIGGGAPIQLTNGANESGARWSPDGSTIFYLSGGEIYLLPSAGGTARQLTHHPGIRASGVSPVTHPTWSPDGRFIYFVATDPRSQTGATADEVRVFGQTDVVQQHLWKIEVETGKEERITSGDWSVLAFRMSRDGRRFAILRAPTTQAIDHYRSDVWVLDADGKNAHAITSNGLYEVDAELSPDGSQVWFLVDANQKGEPYYGQALFVAPAAGGDARMLLQDLGRSVDYAAWGTDSSTIFAVVNLGVRQEIYRVDLKTGGGKSITSADHAIPQGITVVPTAGLIIFQADEATRLGDAWTVPLDGGALTRVTGVYDTLARDFALPRQEQVSWKSPDGVTVEGLLFYPVGYQPGQRYPLVVQLHGGPADSDKFGYGPNFIFNYVPVLAAHGYAVLRPNYRGSTGYGSAFVRDIIGHYFNNMHLDVLAGVDAMIARGVADPDRLAVTGTSAGAHLVNKLITVTSRFKAASSSAGVANWISLLGQTDALTRRTFWIGGTPWQKDAPIDLLWNNSPIKDVAKVTTPTIFFAGERDERVPQAQAMEMYRGLDTNGVPTKLIIGVGESHQWGQPRMVFTKAAMELAWFEQYVTKRPYVPEPLPSRAAPPSQPSR
jgi:dipeptidyl aminopeptidase/acylaminoacyl peptidase